MSYDYSSESKLLELPNPYRLQNRLLWLCAVVLALAGITSLVWARDALQDQALHHAAAPLAAGLLMLAAGIACAAVAARRLRFFFGRGRPHSLAPEIPPGATGNSPRADQIKDILRQGGLTYPEPQGPVEGLLYHWRPNLITAPERVQALAKFHVFNLLAFAVTLLSYLVSSLLFGNPLVRPWIGILYFGFGAFFLLKPLLARQRARLSALSLVLLIAAAILAPVAIGLVSPALPRLGEFSLGAQTLAMLVGALAACGLAVAAVMAQVGREAPQTRASVEQVRLSMNAPPASLIDELDRILQSEWTERIPNRRYARIDPVTTAASPSGSFAGELFDETQPLPVAGTKAPTFGAAFSEPRHRPVLLLDLYATALLLAATVFSLSFVHGFDVLGAWRENRYSLLGTSAILAGLAWFCFDTAATLWGRFDFESVLVWVETVGNYQTSRIGTGNALTSQMNTQNDVVRTESMTLRVWRARIESVAFGKDEPRQVTAMFSTEKEAKALAAHLSEFGQAQSVLVAPGAEADRARMAALGVGERVLGRTTAQDASAASVQQEIYTAAAKSRQAAIESGDAAAPPMFCSACAAPVQPGARYCSNCAAPLQPAG